MGADTSPFTGLPDCWSKAYPGYHQRNRQIADFLALCDGNSPANSQHKGSMGLCHDVIMGYQKDPCDI